MAKKKPATKVEKAHMTRVAEIGCIACLNIGYQGSPAEIHHTRCDVGAGQRSSHYAVIPLCHTHHRTGGHGVAFHAGQQVWEETYGTELSLLNQVLEMVRVK